MKRVLVTGADGFVGRHLCRALEASGAAVTAMRGAPRRGPNDGPDGPAIDVRDAPAVAACVEDARPDAIAHLAGISSVARSYSEPRLTYEINGLGALNVCRAAKAAGARLLLVSSGEVYGALPGDAVATEETPVAPTSPYSASKVVAEVIALQMARSENLAVVCARPFNHLGAGQAPAFAVPSFARQLVAAERAGQMATLRVGNLEPIRDFSHVDDVVEAYLLLLERGVPGEAYNVCAGQGLSIAQVLEELIALSGTPARVEIDPARLRPTDIPRLVGSAAKLRALGWTPRRSLRVALADVLASAREAEA